MDELGFKSPATLRICSEMELGFKVLSERPDKRKRGSILRPLEWQTSKLFTTVPPVLGGGGVHLLVVCMVQTCDWNSPIFI